MDDQPSLQSGNGANKVHLKSVRAPLLFATTCCLLLLMVVSNHSMATVGARPPFQSHQTDLEVYPQNFAIAEDHSGNVIVGNADGILKFDGKRWTLTPLTNKDIVRSLKTDTEQHPTLDRVYVGGYDEFGYIEVNEQGLLNYTNLSTLFASQLNGELFADIWDIAVSPEGVFFQALQHVFYWSPDTGETKIWQWQQRFGAILYHEQNIYLQFRGEGFRYFKADQWEPIDNTHELQDLVVSLVPLPDGDLLTVSRDGKWRTLNRSGVATFDMPKAMPASSNFTDGIMVDQRTLAFTADTGVLYLYDTETSQIEKVEIGLGFLSDLTLTQQGNVLVVDDASIYNIPWPTSWKLLDRFNGLKGSVYALVDVDNDLFAMTGSGVFKKTFGESNFNRLDWTEHEAWDALVLGNHTIIFADSYDLKLATATGVETLSDEVIYPRILARSVHNPNLIYVGTEFGIALLESIDEQWRVVFSDSNMKNLRVTSIVETAENSILIGSERGGLQNIKFTFDEKWHANANHIEPEEINVTAEVSITTHEENILISTGNGFYEYKDEKLTPALPELNALRESSELITLASAPNGELWGYTYRTIYHRSSDKDQAEQTWHSPRISNVRQGSINSIDFSATGTVMVGANASAMLHNAMADNVEETSNKPSRVRLTSVEVNQAEQVSNNLPLVGQAEIPQGGSVSFRYVAPDLIEPEKVQYRARLLPFETTFSEWSNNAQFTYYGLTPENYTFEVEAIDSAGNQSKILPYHLKVQPYWYQQSSIRAIGILLALILIALIIRQSVQVRSRKLALENQRLESMVTERTRELASANRQLESLAHLDSLTSIANRRKLDEYLEQVWTQCQERNRGMAIVMLDVDHFKQFNDTHGHLAGDELLKELAQILSSSLRRGEDLVARYGGEEFLVVLPGADNGSAMGVAESMRINVEASRLGITVSAGVASTEAHQYASVDALIKASDDSLYKAKDGGRNLVILHR